MTNAPLGADFVPSTPIHPALRHKLQALPKLQAAEAANAAPIPSPCVSVCQLDASQHHCIGCLRTLDELRAWGQADAATRLGIWHKVAVRCAQASVR